MHMDGHEGTGLGDAILRREAGEEQVYTSETTVLLVVDPVSGAKVRKDLVLLESHSGGAWRVAGEFGPTDQKAFHIKELKGWN